jgi:2-oxoisovalerate dehydrogenase E1 component alpha subunit
MDMPMVDAVRQAAVRLTDLHSMGRNFVGHYALRKWNVVPVSSVIEVKFAMAPGTAMVQKRHGGDGVTVVIGGDAGSSEGDFATCMIWSTRPGQELPVLMIVMNNQWGISTPMQSQHSEQRIVDRGEPFGIPGEAVDGNDPIASWHALRRAFQWCRRKRRPFMLEPNVSRLHGHSSSSGAVRVSNEPDCLDLFEDKLLATGLLTRESLDETWDAARAEADAAAQQALREPEPTPDDVRRHTYAPSPVDAVYPDDYTGLPQ